MLERETVQHRGFRNVVKNGEVIGFQVCVRQQAYRGTFLSEHRVGPVIVDGVEYPPEQQIWTIGGIEYTVKEMENLGRVIWPLYETATIFIKKPGGLSQGEHEVQAIFGHIASYIPPVADDLALKFAANEKPRKLIIV